MQDAKPTNRERLQEITAGIEQGIKELFESEKYMRYLSVMFKFHRYSVNNTMLIYMQHLDATLVAGFNKWKKQFERHVKKGEHGITIIAPTPYKKKIEEMERDLTVYIIQEGENPVMAFDTTDLDVHDGIFALPREEWEKRPEFDKLVKDRMAHQEEREQAFLSHKGDCFAIYQVKHTDKLRDIRYEGLEWLGEAG